MTAGLRNAAYRAYKALETREHSLQYLFLEITRQCNLACLHCGSDCGRDASRRELSLDTWISVLDCVKAAWDPFIVITGGEPLVRDDLPGITGALARRGMRWGMVTNGFALDAERFARLAGDGLSSMTVSLDGPPEAHRKLRRHPEAFERALRALRLLGASRLAFKDAVTCVHPGNIEELDRTAAILLDAGITSWRLFRIFPKGSAARHPELFLDRGQTERLLAWIAGQRPALARRGLDLAFSCEGYLPFKLDRSVRGEPYFCRAGINIASVLSDGTVTGCNNNGPQFHQGSIAESSLVELWDTRFQEYRDRRWARTGRCAGCGHWRDCLGGSIHLRDKDQAGPGFCYLPE